MPLNIIATDPQTGQDINTSYQQLAMDLQNAGHQIKMDPTGMNFEIGGQVLPVSSVLQQMGLNVKSMAPAAPNYETANMGLRFAVSQLGDDDQKKAYLENVLRRQNPFGQPQVMGSGEDWHFFDPQKNSWNALTNKPGVDWSDLGEYGPKAAQMAAATGGAIAGGLFGAGPGSIPLAMAGAGAGSALAAAASRGMLLASDDDFAAVTSAGEQAKQALPGVAVDALAPGAFAGIRAVAPFVSKLAPASATATGVGQAMQTTGKLTGSTAKFIQESPLAKDVFTAINPLTQTAQLAGYGMQAPAFLTKAGARGLGHLGESEVGQAVLGKGLAKSASKASENLLKTKTPPDLGTRIASKITGKTPGAEEATAADILGNLGESAGRQLTPELRLVQKALALEVKQGRMTKQEMSKILSDTILSNQRKVDIATKMGRETGKVMEGASELGKGIAGIANKATDMQLRGLQGFGSGMQGAGSAIKTAGQIARPLEPYLWMRGLGGPYAEEQVGKVTRRLSWPRREEQVGNLFEPGENNMRSWQKQRY